MSALIDEYEARMTAAREACAQRPGVDRMTSPDCDEDLFALCLLRYCAHGVHMTHDVERWIAGAGERCTKLGMTELGRALQAHARAEAGHDRMMVADAHALAAWWNERHCAAVEAGPLLAQGPLTSSQAYIDLHEGVIAGPSPYCQLAIEYEIEQLSVTLGTAVVENCRRVFGERAATFSFLAEHVELDVGHTAFNRRQLGQVLEDSPETLADMVEIGQLALGCYADFVAECCELAESSLEAASAATAA